MKSISRSLGLLHLDNGVIRVPILIKGGLVAPPEISADTVRAAFEVAGKDTVYLKLPGCQLVREPVIDKTTFKLTGEYIYQVLPPVDARDLIETDFDSLATDLYALPVEEILAYLDTISRALGRNREIVQEVRDLCRLTSELPDALLDGWLDALHIMFDRSFAAATIDSELGVAGAPGKRFLEDWVESDAMPLLPTAMLFGNSLNAGSAMSAPRASVRAMPTRQLHIAAGNAPEIPLICLLRAIFTKSAAVVKCPHGTTLPAALFALAAATAVPDHPITRHLSLVYWRGGDDSIESRLLFPNAFDRIVVWGTAETVKSVQDRAPFTRIISFSPRYSVSLIGKEAFADLDQVASLACLDSVIHDQKACTASLVHYVEGSRQDAERYADAVSRALAGVDAAIPRFVASSTKGAIKRLQRGKYSAAKWYLNGGEDSFSSGAVVMDGEFDVLDHPMARLVVVRPVADLKEALKYIHGGVSAVGVYPEARRLTLRDTIAARGASTIAALGQCDRVFPGMPQDGMMALAQLVDWKSC